MSIRIIPKAQQGYGAFNGGEIVENKPIGFPQDHASIRPYSNLFYWAHAKAVVDSTIGLHPHQGFEICSFVLKGSIRHYDTKLREWRPLQAGDVQIIRAGSGISHSEWIEKDGEIFQIWFDPNLSKTLSQPASYDDYPAAGFPEKNIDQTKITTLVGPGSPFEMDTPGVEVYTINIDAGKFNLPIASNQICSAYVLDGHATLNGESVQWSDFVLAEGVDKLEITTEGPATLFIILSPEKLDYRTYGEMRG